MILEAIFLAKKFAHFFFSLNNLFPLFFSRCLLLLLNFGLFWFIVSIRNCNFLLTGRIFPETIFRYFFFHSILFFFLKTRNTELLFFLRGLFFGPPQGCGPYCGGPGGERRGPPQIGGLKVALILSHLIRPSMGHLMMLLLLLLPPTKGQAKLLKLL